MGPLCLAESVPKWFDRAKDFDSCGGLVEQAPFRRRRPSSQPSLFASSKTNQWQRKNNDRINRTQHAERAWYPERGIPDVIQVTLQRLPVHFAPDDQLAFLFGQRIYFISHSRSFFI